MKHSNSFPYKTLFSALFVLAMPSKAYAADQLKTVNVYEKTDKSEPKKSAERINLEENFYKPYSKEVVGKQTIQDENIPDVTEAIRDLPGVTITETGAFNKRVRIRGLQGARVVTLVDGVKIANQGMNPSGSGEINMTDISTVEKIEVIKGSPSVMFDPGASGGVINVMTAQAPFKKGLGFKQQLSYDEGYNKKSSSTQLEGSTGDIGMRVIYTREDARDYKISGEDQKKLAISRTNSLLDLNPTGIPVEDLGYESEAISTRLSAKAGKDGVIDINWDRWMGKDMASVYGPSIQEASVIQYDRMDRDLAAIGYRKKELGFLSNFNMKYAKQSLFEAIGRNAKGTKLDSDNFNIFGDIILNDLEINLGGEVILDKAETLVKSEQDYYAGFVNLEYRISDWTLFAGGRYNHWTTRQIQLADANKKVDEQLVGISGHTPEKTLTSPTWSLGTQYEITPNQNVSLNLNTTFRSPTLYERYAFGNFLGGGMDMEPEKGSHAELSWKYLDSKLAITANTFYSDFENYIWSKTIDRLINKEGLLQCIAAGHCDPTKGEYNNRKSDFYSSVNKYYNAGPVTNWGAELFVQYNTNQHETGGNISFNEIRSDDPYVKANSQPLNINAHYKYTFNKSWSPWFKVKAQHVADIPQVIQYGGFKPYTVGHIYAGFKTHGFIVSGGVRNISDETYHVAYNGINALARSYFASVSFEFHTK